MGMKEMIDETRLVKFRSQIFRKQQREDDDQNNS